MSTVKLEDIRTDGGTQMRASLNEEVVSEYAGIIRDGTDFAPVILFHDGSKFWLADGFHRFHAYRMAGALEIPADVRQGTKRDAILFSVGANASHGLRRTNEDKRKAVLTLLKDKEWAAWSDREIARRVGVGHPLVADVRSGLTGISSSEDRAYTTKHGTTATMDTAKIGGTPEDREARRAAREAEQAENDRLRDEARAGLPDDIKQREDAKEAAIAGRSVVEGSAPTSGLSAEDRIAELEAANSSLEAEVFRLSEECKLFGEMRAEWEKGGFAEVIAGKDEVIRGQAARLESESHEKVKNLRSADRWKKRAIELGWSNNEVIDLSEKARAHG